MGVDGGGDSDVGVDLVVISSEVHTEDELIRWIAEDCGEAGHDFYHRTTLRAEPGTWQ
ncbi:hypothetical protein [Streptomyces lunaelactis]|uniref:hypothetical protein n=1 Tax=Streptomyces lunaelactis TaxID=1535768 RepID=UPI001585A5E9|nr:hypothetical protein [Streptomyces lunaelactis]NUK23446.1 hypothetical protein [Streptomyces lunaelactis]